MKKYIPKVGEEINIRFYDHFQTEGERIEAIVSDMPCVITMKDVKVVHISELYIVVEVVHCTIPANTEYWSVIRSTIFDVKVIK